MGAGVGAWVGEWLSLTSGWLGDWQVPWPSAMTPGPEAVDRPSRTWRTLLNLWRWGRTPPSLRSWGQGNGRSLPR